jgi:hypothetical protein
LRDLTRERLIACRKRETVVVDASAPSVMEPSESGFITAL